MRRRSKSSGSAKRRATTTPWSAAKLLNLAAWPPAIAFRPGQWPHQPRHREFAGRGAPAALRQTDDRLSDAGRPHRARDATGRRALLGHRRGRQCRAFAGQHETYLNITGIDAVAQAVIRCWASFYSERALAYRRQQGLPVDTVQPAVLIQHLVVADVSAVVFSANPVTGNRDKVVINAAWGLGESLVSGTVTPDTYLVRKADLMVTGSQIADKQRMTVAIPEGAREVDVPRILRRQPALDDAQAIEMAQLARSLENAMGYPVDVECAFSGGRLYLLQCRPIARLRHRSDCQHASDHRDLYRTEIYIVGKKG